ITCLTLRTEQGQNRVNVICTSVPTEILGGGPSVVTLGTGGPTSNIRGIHSRVGIDNQVDQTAIVIDDSGDRTLQTFIVGVNPGNSSAGFVHDFDVAGFSINYSYPS